MVFNSLIVLSVAHLSADAWQQIACIHFQDRVNSSQLLDLICCFPLEQLSRLALCLWTFLCLPPPDSFFTYSYSSSSSSDDDDDHDHGPGHTYAHASSSSSPVDLDDHYYNPHSDWLPDGWFSNLWHLCTVNPSLSHTLVITELLQLISLVMFFELVPCTILGNMLNL